MHFVANLGLFWQQNLQTWTTEAALGKMFRGVCRVSKQFVCSLRNEASFSNQRTSMQYKSGPATILVDFSQRLLSILISSLGNQVKWLIERKLNVQKDRDHRTHHRAQLDQPEISDLAPGCPNHIHIIYINHVCSLRGNCSLWIMAYSTAICLSKSICLASTPGC